MNLPSLGRPLSISTRSVLAVAWCFQSFGSWQADLDRLFMICRRTIKFTRSLESFTATVVGCGVPGVYLNRVGVIRDCFINFPSRAVSEAAMIEGVGILRTDFDSLSEIRNGANVVALGLEGAAATKVGVAV